MVADLCGRTVGLRHVAPIKEALTLGMRCLPRSSVQPIRAVLSTFTMSLSSFFSSFLPTVHADAPAEEPEKQPEQAPAEEPAEEEPAAEEEEEEEEPEDVRTLPYATPPTLTDDTRPVGPSRHPRGVRPVCQVRGCHEALPAMRGARQRRQGLPRRDLH